MGPLSYQWRFNSAPINGGIQSAYSIASAQLTNSGSYDVVVTNAVSAATSAVATITVAAPELVSLRIARSGTNVLLSWPASASTLALYCASNLTPTVSWQAVANPVVPSNLDNTVTLPPGLSSRFFRLLTPPRSNAVRAPDWSIFQAGTPSESNSAKVVSILRHACKYAMTTWWSSYCAAQDATNYLNFGGTQESQIRRPAMEAYGLAVALQTGTYDPVLAGVSEADARSRMLKLIRSLGYRHLVNQAGGWGNDWQTALWAGLAGTAGWMLWPDLSATDQECVRRRPHRAGKWTAGFTATWRRDSRWWLIWRIGISRAS